MAVMLVLFTCPFLCIMLGAYLGYFITFSLLLDRYLFYFTGTLWVAGKVCPGQGRVAVPKVPDLLQQRWMLSPTTPEQLAQAPGHGGQQEQSSQRAS